MHGTCLPINAFSYSCKCLQGHGGVLCDEDEELFNPCQSIRCKHGKCRLSGLGKPYCECSSGYTGDSCDKGKQLMDLSFHVSRGNHPPTHTFLSKHTNQFQSCPLALPFMLYPPQTAQPLPQRKCFSNLNSCYCIGKKNKTIFLNCLCI